MKKLNLPVTYINKTSRYPETDEESTVSVTKTKLHINETT